MTHTSARRTAPLAASIRSRVLVFALGVTGAGVNAQLAIPGQFDVTPVGAATYTVPIQVPPGIAGIQPKLALSYNSQGGNGQLGVGWGLEGLSSITRCPRTKPQDGVKGAVSFNADDRFCLDGKRLVLVSGTYGAANSSYRTEIETFANVTAAGVAGSGPQYFIVKTKDGLTMEFGNTVDSRATVTGLDVVRRWSMNKLSDAKGNYLTVSYTQPTPGTLYPDRIDYTGSSAKGLAPTNSVHFGYVDRSDIIDQYQAGHSFRTTRLLSTVTTKTDNATVWIYTNKYEAGAGGRSRIAAISLCEPSGLCTAETRVGYGGVEPPDPWFKTIVPVTTTGTVGPTRHWFPIDLNGDGRTDVIQFGAGGKVNGAWQWDPDGVYSVWFSEGGGNFSVKRLVNEADKTDKYWGFWRLLDVNGDGLMDIVHLTTIAGDVRIWKSNGDGTFAITKFTNTTYTDTNINGLWQILDVNGDGLADLVHQTQIAGDTRIWKSNGDGTFAIEKFVNSTDTALTTGSWQVLDVNGDGLADMVHLGAGAAQVWTSKGDGTFTITAFTNAVDLALTDGRWQQLDANGDGLVDLIHLTSGSGDTRVWLSKGNGTFKVSKVTDATDTVLTTGNWHVLDLNGDGLSDLIHTAPNMEGGKYWTWESKGDGTFTVTAGFQNVDLNQDPLCSSSETACAMTVAGDFLGTGSPGFVHMQLANIRAAWLHGVSARNVATAVTNGLGGGISWKIDVLPSMLVRQSYVKDIPSDSSVWTVTSAMPVVTSISMNTGWVHDSSQASQDNFTFLTYGSARMERNGRGFVGFDWLQTTESRTRITTRRYFRHDFPFTGLVSKQGTGKDGAWDNLSLSSTSYGCTHLDGGTTCSVSAGARYFLYASQIDGRAWDLDGTPLPRSKVVNSEPDTFGNIQKTASYVLNPDGSSTDHSKLVTNKYYNDPTKWIIGKLVKSITESTGPTVAQSVVPGSGNLPAAPEPQLPPQLRASIGVILQFLLSDD